MSQDVTFLKKGKAVIDERYTPFQHSNDNTNSLLRLTITPIQANVYCATIIIPVSLIDIIFYETAQLQQASVSTFGFGQGEVPLAYIQEYYKEHLIEHMKEFLFKFCVINTLYREIRNLKLLIAGEPRLIDIMIEPGQDAHFRFEVSLFPNLVIHDWKYFPFKAPKRKNYKDIDRQVESFIKDESDYFEQNHDHVSIGDWVCFDLTLMSNQHGPLEHFSQKFWFKIGDEEIENPVNEMFLHRKNGDNFITNNKGLQEYLSHQLATQYSFRVTITDVLPQLYFDFELFKKHFKIKTNKDMHKKLIEVFSYRNDLSQRRAMVEESIKLLLSKHRFSIPTSLILRQQKLIVDAMQQNPDYNVYRMQKDFQDYVRQLAEKQVREMIFIDQLSYHENVEVNGCDVKCYLNLTNRPRMKEFLYFDTPSTKSDGQEIPIPEESLKRLCLREKTANLIIFHLTKQ